nr:hypothetical protein [Tanacetum cinerariifolium]
GIVETLEELHSNQTFHHNFAPEHVLLKVAGSDVVVKLCGLGSSILTKKPFILDNYLATEKLRLGKTLWNLLSNGKYKFKEDGIPSNFESGPIFNHNLEGLEPMATDLIQKILTQKGVSVRLTTREFDRWDFNTLNFSSFENNWLLVDNQDFREWFISINDTFEDQSGIRWQYQQPGRKIGRTQQLFQKMV